MGKTVGIYPSIFFRFLGTSEYLGGYEDMNCLSGLRRPAFLEWKAPSARRGRCLHSGVAASCDKNPGAIRDLLFRYQLCARTVVVAPSNILIGPLSSRSNSPCSGFTSMTRPQKVCRLLATVIRRPMSSHRNDHSV